MKLQLEQTRFQKKNGVPWASCAPFVDNSRALLIHRPRNVTIYKTTKERRHIAITFWCGNSSCGTDEFTFLDSLDGRKFVCKRCEEAALKNGLPSADELSGQHIHTEKVVAVQTCCEGATK